jgi:hypothetical protein
MPRESSSMKVLVQSAMVFLGTVAAAALIVFGEPAQSEVRMAQTAPQADAVLVALLAAD